VSTTVAPESTGPEGGVRPLGDDDIRAVAAGIKPLPASVIRLSQLVHDPDANAKAIVDVLSLEPRLAAQVIRRANSASITGRNPVTTVKDAVMRIGFSGTLAVALGQVTMNTLNGAVPAYGVVQGELWRRAMASSIAAEVIIEHIHRHVPSDALTCALVHEVGKIAIVRHYGDDALVVLRRIAEERFVKQPQIEREVLGADHAQIGAAIVRAWGLPEAVAEGVEDYPSAFSFETVTPTVTRLAHLVGLALTRSSEAEDGYLTAEELIRNLGVRVMDPRELAQLTAARVAAFFKN
jgi:HD-like signal output (HDOD) protein